jgi:hypothetical protein
VRALQVGQRGADDGRGADQVHCDDAVPVGAVDVPDVAAGVDARGGHDGVEAAVLLGDLAHGRLGAARVGEVLCAEREAVRRPAHVEHDRRAALGLHGGGDGRAEARRAAGDDHGAEPSHAASVRAAPTSALVERPAR